jgi:acyl-CoA synthetase (NDP forming)
VSELKTLDPIFAPRSVAVVGASRDPAKRGYQAVRTLMEGHFAGQVYPVNPNGGDLLGLPVARSVDDLVEPPDLAFVVTPASTVPGILDACARRGARGAVVSASGFRETGEAGASLEHDITEVVHRTGIRLVGPNTSGIFNTDVGLNLVGVRDVPKGRIALLSQSGNVALDVINEATNRGCGMSIYAGVGNETDIAFHEYLEYLEDHEPTSVILMYVEGFRDGRRFIDVARRVSMKKPIVLLKGGRSNRGVAAARSHTGAIAGSYPVLRATLRQGGVSEVQRSDELLSVAVTLASQPPLPSGTDVVVLSDGGGHGTLAADALAALGVPLTTLRDETKERLRALLGGAASVENPVDVAGAADRNPAVLADAVEILAEDPGAGGIFLVGLFGGYAVRFADELVDIECEAAGRMAEVMAHAAKPLVVHSLYAARRPEPLRRLGRAGVPVVGSLEVGSRCLRAAHARGLHLGQQPVSLVRPKPRREQPAAIVAARRERRTAMMETEVRELLLEYQVPLAEGTLCRSAGEVTAAIERGGGLAALKVVAPTIPHKTEVGGVVLNVAASEGAAAFQRILRAASTYVVDHGLVPDVRGVLVMPMLPPPVAELIVGVRHDAQFGPVLTTGAGGIGVEIHHDAALRGLPIGRPEVFEMLDETRTSALLNGYRGRPAVNREVLADLILGIAACALAHPELEELEANPVFAYADRAVVVDARAFLKDLTAPVRELGDMPDDENGVS